MPPAPRRQLSSRPNRLAPRHLRRAWRAAAVPAALLLAARADAQPRRGPRQSAPAPTTWLSATVGLLQAETILDGRTNAAWDFADNVVQYRATLETVYAGATVGVQGTWAPAVPTTVRALGLADRPALAACQPECAATTDLLGIEAIGRVGGGPGLHQVIELSAGVQQVRSLRLDGGETLPPERDSDLHAAIGYGIGYSISPRAAVALVQEFGIVSHQRDFLPRDRNGLTQQRATRLTVRFGAGARR